MYALDADTGQARWLSARERRRSSGPTQYVSGVTERSTDRCPRFGDAEAA